MKRLTLAQEKFQKQLLSASILYGMACCNSSVESILFRALPTLCFEVTQSQNPHPIPMRCTTSAFLKMHLMTSCFFDTTHGIENPCMPRWIMMRVYLLFGSNLLPIRDLPDRPHRPVQEKWHKWG